MKKTNRWEVWCSKFDARKECMYVFDEDNEIIFCMQEKTKIPEYMRNLGKDNDALSYVENDPSLVDNYRTISRTHTLFAESEFLI
jgi:hypothetical protein